MLPSREVLVALFENVPRFTARLADEEVESYSELLDRAEQIAAQMPEDEQLELIDGHPRIGAAPQTVSATSFREQGYDRDPGTAELQARLDRLNEAYEAEFGFRFVIFVAGRPRTEIADAMEGRMLASREEELERALSDVFLIARSRLDKLSRPLEEAR
ncbi:MAG: 2-oxo-4-hydroxy-4-carboxy-5-ureidoimidazoline decarboxylase [Chloroflexota bacterium]